VAAALLRLIGFSFVTVRRCAAPVLYKDNPQLLADSEQKASLRVCCTLRQHLRKKTSRKSKPPEKQQPSVSTATGTTGIVCRHTENAPDFKECAGAFFKKKRGNIERRGPQSGD
jgi:hypothetical protein